nr:MAG TPA: hypothetical protein [Bacteriophage sp.]
MTWWDSCYIGRKIVIFSFANDRKIVIFVPLSM